MAFEFTLYPDNRDYVGTNPATPDTRNAHNVLDFDDTTDESAVFTLLLPDAYASGGLSCEIGWSHAATTGNVQWQLSIERIGTALDIDTDSFAAANVNDDEAVPGTSGNLTTTAITFTDGADMDSWAAGELGRIKVVKVDATTSAASGDTEFHYLQIKES